MSIRSHRVIKIVYDDNSMNFHTGDEIFNAIVSSDGANDQTNMDGGGIVEIPFRGLKEILKNKTDYEFTEYQINELKQEIKRLTKLGVENDSYITYDMF